MDTLQSKIQSTETDRRAHGTHAAIISGGSAEECFQRAMAWAKRLVCEDSKNAPCGKCRHCLKAEEGIHPDIIVVSAEGDKREITVGAVRAMRKEVFVVPNEAAAKVFVIRDAENLNVSAQNAMLKILEEPPEYAVFLLATSAPEMLLPTVCSRCWSVRAAFEQEQSIAAADEGKRYLELLRSGSELALAEFCVVLEKVGKQGMIKFLDEASQTLDADIREHAQEKDIAERACALELICSLRKMADFNVGAGHIAGKLLAESIAIISK